MKISAADKATGRSESITITNDKDRFSKEDIERMVAEGEKFAAEDEQQRKRVETLNGLSSFVFGLKSQLADKAGLGGKLEGHDKDVLAEVVKDGVDWIEENGHNASLEDLEEKFEGMFSFTFRWDVADIPSVELRNIVNPITGKLYQDDNSSSKESADKEWEHDRDEL